MSGSAFAGIGAGIAAEVGTGISAGIAADIGISAGIAADIGISAGIAADIASRSWLSRVLLAAAASSKAHETNGQQCCTQETHSLLAPSIRSVQE